MFDNQRLLHARSAIAPTDGQRLVQGCYLNRDGVELESEVLLLFEGRPSKEFLFTVRAFH